MSVFLSMIQHYNGSTAVLVKAHGSHARGPRFDPCLVVISLRMVFCPHLPLSTQVIKWEPGNACVITLAGSV